MHPDFDSLVGGVLRRDADGVVAFVGDTHPAPGEMLRTRWSETLPDVESRSLLLPRLMPEQYFAMIPQADVILDTLYFGGANTAYDAFAAGVPVVTLPAELPRGRYTYALYRELGVEGCIAASHASYVELAVRLGTDAAYCSDIAAQLRDAAPALFEQRAAVTQLEEFFIEALEAARGS